jgi:dihydroflavonol-4-reductase
MSKVLVTSTPALVARRVILRLVAACREVRTIVETPTHAAEVRAMLGTREVQPGTRMSFIAADSDDDAGRLDAAAGCEFVDDRIRLRE